MLTLEQALQHGAAVGVKYYVKNSYDKIVGGTCTEEQALSMKKRFERRQAQPLDKRIHPLLHYQNRMRFTI